jgi:hypothetical protein
MAEARGGIIAVMVDVTQILSKIEPELIGPLFRPPAPIFIHDDGLSLPGCVSSD